MLLFDACEVRSQQWLNPLGQNGHAVLLSFAIPHHDLVVCEIHVFSAQAHALHQPQTAAIQQSGHQAVSARECIQQAVNLCTGQNHGKPLGPFGASKLTECADGFPNDLLIQKDQRIQGLVLGPC
jgi:hypothetical protein